ncbi:hypothetical protein [Streptomyces sp. YGL11-2]|uniref:hypothetical protein n=1 Tax=Streptomyces sp. YGL11-2 TaxID=3414028 RepID=UPI003CEFB6E3
MDSPFQALMALLTPNNRSWLEGRSSDTQEEIASSWASQSGGVQVGDPSSLLESPEQRANQLVNEYRSQPA